MRGRAFEVRNLEGSPARCRSSWFKRLRRMFLMGSVSLGRKGCRTSLSERPRRIRTSHDYLVTWRRCRSERYRLTILEGLNRLCASADEMLADVAFGSKSGNTFRLSLYLSALPPKADVTQTRWHVRSVCHKLPYAPQQSFAPSGVPYARLLSSRSAKQRSRCDDRVRSSSVALSVACQRWKSLLMFPRKCEWMCGEALA